MQSYWVEFTDGSAACCDGNSPYDAAIIAEHITGKKVRDGGDKFKPEGVLTLPYPATPIIWSYDHPVHGKCPAFCYSPKECKGRTACPKAHACDD